CSMPKPADFFQSPPTFFHPQSPVFLFPTPSMNVIERHARIPLCYLCHVIDYQHTQNPCLTKTNHYAKLHCRIP
ncbi:hypothetical protein, partial [Bacteroides pyogenes]|uniref:hypothetical protein n=1 Tax=Bacteroides pyogenes TaxID=310300 RepID=UPI001E49A5C7